jgi:hypothetical protein
MTSRHGQGSLPRPGTGHFRVSPDLGGPDGPLSRRTWQEWRAKGTGPKCIKLPNGELRIRRAEYDRWLNSREAA